MIPTLENNKQMKNTFNIRLYSSVCCALCTEYEEWIILNKLQKKEVQATYTCVMHPEFMLVSPENVPNVEWH
jgi:hypothetical protein